MKIAKNCSRPLSGQGGSMILVTLMIMAILSITGVYAISISSTEMQATSNYQTQKMAFSNADAGVQYTLMRIRQDLNNDIDLEDVDPSDLATYPVPSGFSFQIVPDGLPWTGAGPFSFTSTGQDGHGRGATFAIEVKFETAEEIASAFNYALLSEGDIEISGSANITGDIHSNRNVTQTGGGGNIEGNITAVGTASAGSADAENYTVSSGVERIEVPRITDEDFAYWRSIADIKEPGSGILSEQGGAYVYDIGSSDNPEDLTGRIIYVDGNLLLKGHVFNGTFVATGNIEIKGSSQLNASGEIGTAMIAGGDILFNGSANSYGAFWANGGFRQNGSSAISGSIVAGGGGIVGDLIDINGSLTFTWSDDINNSHLPSEFKVRLTSWADKAIL